MSDVWTRFCVVGFGGHAKNRLIPAILANGQELAGLVTQKDIAGIADTQRFDTLALAMDALPPGTAFILSSPPSAHFAQACEALRGGYDVIVEKPAFVTRAEADSASALAHEHDAILVEGFMSREAEIYRRLVARCRAAAPSKFEITFTIPVLPEDTFRTGNSIAASNLYDVASYAIALLIDIGLSTSNVVLEAVDNAGDPLRERLHLRGRLGSTEVTVTAGVDAGYANSVEAHWHGDRNIFISPAFYGRAGQRLWREQRSGVSEESMIEEPDAFRTMLATPRSVWRKSAKERIRRMGEITATLDRLGVSLTAFRTAAAANGNSKPVCGAATA